MPIYEYKCRSCNEHMEVMQKISDPKLTVCPECGGELTKLISNTSFVLKGGGWYADGYSSSEKKKADKKTDSKVSPSDSTSKPDTKAKSPDKKEKTAKKTAPSGA